MYSVSNVRLWNAELASSSPLQTADPREFSMQAKKKQAGFSLIELLIVVAIILIIASIAIPSLMRARMNANEASAVGSIRTINSGMISYMSTFPTIGFPATLSALGGTSCAPPSPASACLIPSDLAAGSKSGYNFTLTGVSGSPAATYQVIGSPSVANSTGVRYFCSFADSMVRASVTPIAACDYTTTPLQ
jgi:type IV pilus assembly protein PilA